ncbi:hypothetical protein [Prevotella sp.]|nr:hypothetical protein [Prevotella sp.]
MTKAQIKNYLVDTAVDEMTKYLIEDYNISIGDALDVIYNSETFQKMGDADTGLYTQSPLYIYELLNREYQTGRFGYNTVHS